MRCTKFSIIKFTNFQLHLFFKSVEQKNINLTALGNFNSKLLSLNIFIGNYEA